MKNSFSETTVSEIVRQDFRAARVFKNHHIDFCCGGQKSLKQVCSERNIKEETLKDELTQMLYESVDLTPDFNSWPLDLLIDYIEKKHHRYVEETAPILNQYLKKLEAVHSDGAPYLAELRELFQLSSGNLAQHMKKEELVLFPYIRKMVDAKDGKIPDAPFGSISSPISMMMHEHDTEGEHFRQMAEITNDYEIPSWGCNTFHVSMKLLKEFQDDLHIHIHLENNILFPKSLDFESQNR